MFNNVSRDKAFYVSAFALSWPVIMQNLLNNSLAFVDSFMLSTLGERYLSSISLANTIFTIVNLILFGLQSGSTVLIAQYHGKNDQTSINRVLGIALGLSFAIGTTITLAVFFFSVPIYSLTSSDMELVMIAADFGRVAAFSILLNAVSIVYLSAHRSMENPRLGMYVLGATMLLKTFFNWVFIIGAFGLPSMGIRGAAMATLLSRVFEFVVTLGYALYNKRFKLQPKALFHPGKAILMDFLKYSLPVVINETVWGIGSSMYTVIFGHLPNASSALAAHAIVMNLERMINAIHSGLSHAAAIIVGRELGAGRRDNAYQYGMTMLTMTVSFGGVSALIMAALSYSVILPFFFPLFGATAYTQEIGGTILLIATATIPFKALNFVSLVGLLRGGGDMRAGMVIDLSCIYGVGLPLSALASFVFNAPVSIVFLMMCMDEFVKGLVVIWRIRQKKWLKDLTR